MDLYTINYIKKNPLVYNYLRVNSAWYELLNLDRSYLKSLEKEAKKYYGVRIEDKIKKVSNSIEMIADVLDIIK